MGRGSSKAGGSSGKSAGKAKKQISSLTAFKENAKQLNEAKIEAKKRHAAEVHYTDMTGKTYKLYWNGAAYTDKKSKMAAQYSDMSGIYKAKFKIPEDW